MKVKHTDNKQFKSNEYENKCNKVIKFCEEYNKFIDNNEQECLKGTIKTEFFDFKL